MTRRDSNHEPEGWTVTTAAAPDIACEVRRTIEKQFKRVWIGPPNAYLTYLDGTELHTASYVTFSLNVIGFNAEDVALGALQQEMNPRKRFEANGEPMGFDQFALVWRTKPEITDGKLWFRLAIIPAHIVQVLLTPAD